jgi:glucose-1-phosphate thymidylyltransferase
VRPDDSLIRDWYRTVIRPARLRITFADQDAPRGTADALLAAADFAGDSVVLMLNGDNHYPAHIVRELAAAHAAALPGFDAQSLVELGGIQADRLRAYAILRVNEAGDLVDIVEKPDEATFRAAGPHALISMNIWSFPPAIFEACRAVTPSPRGELELADAVRYAIRDLGVHFAVRPYTAAVLDLSNRRDIAAVTERLRDRSVMV